MNDDLFQAKHYEVSGWFIAFDALINSFWWCVCALLVMKANLSNA